MPTLEAGKEWWWIPIDSIDGLLCTVWLLSLESERFLLHELLLQLTIKFFLVIFKFKSHSSEFLSLCASHPLLVQKFD